MDERRKHTERQFEKLQERLQHLELQQARFMAHLESEQGHYAKHYTELRGEIRTLAKVVRGNGTAGLETRLDRIERKESFRSKIEVAGMIAIMMWLGSALWTVIKAQP